MFRSLRPAPAAVATDAANALLGGRERSLLDRGVGARFVRLDIDARNPQIQAGAPNYYVAAERLKDLASARKLFALVGPRGRGKTQLACALCRWWYVPDECNRGVAYRTALGYLDGVRAAGAKVREFKKTHEEVGLLVLDEIQDRNAPDWLDVSFGELIDVRYANRKPTLLLSNLTPDALIDNVGPKTQRRLIEEGGIIEATWARIHELLSGGNGREGDE